MAGTGHPLPADFAANAINSSGNEAASTTTSESKMKKRTKTGCLTCRKRRIKCGEERPTCNNCIKSKRHCEGYNQRVIFKPPLGDWSSIHPGSAGTIPFHNGMLPAMAPFQRSVPPPVNTQDAALTPLQPRLDQKVLRDEKRNSFHGTPSSSGWPGPPYAPPVRPPPTPLVPSWASYSPQYGQSMFPPQQSPMSASTHPSLSSQISASSGPHSGFMTSLNLEQNWQRGQQWNAFTQPPTPASSVLQEFPSFSPENTVPTPESSSTQSHDGARDHFPFLSPEPMPSYWDPGNVEFISVNTNPSPHFPELPPQYLSWNDPQLQDCKPTRPDGLTSILPFTPIEVPDQHSAKFQVNFVGTADDLLDQAAVEYEDDDYFDVQSDDEMEAPLLKLQKNQRDFGMIMALHRQHSSEVSMRRYDTFIYAGILDHYRAEWVANPLRNPKTARVFAHFIFATGPTISIFERHPRNASVMFSDQPVPNYQRGLWTYILPTMALNHQGLLHAMLALASLHIAKLQRASVTPSYKHYAYALKRIHHCVGNRKKRHMPATIAATLLLGFYEVMTADHLKWSSHLAGAKQLLIEIDFKGMTREYRHIRAERAFHNERNSFGDVKTVIRERNFNHAFKDPSPAIDEGLVSIILGRKMRYDEFGRVVEEDIQQPMNGDALPPPLDTNKYELCQDLFWWYARQDMYQAIISGNRLLLDYSRWADCPPRASMGRADATYGTHDHLILLLGRIADFTARDRDRKLRVLQANGGQWRPPPDMDIGPSDSGRQHFVPPSSGTSFSQDHLHGPRMPLEQREPTSDYKPSLSSPPQMPMFFGMTPIPMRSNMPSSYVIDGKTSSPSPKVENGYDDLDAATQSALEEWHQIRSALNTFKSHLGPQFQPLSPELHQPSSTPFGPALQYGSYDVAVLWALYYMSYIIAIRSHPHLPPAAMMAAGVAAQQTSHFAQLIGQIAGGIVPPHPGQPLNPSLGASLCELSMPLFFAGIQYRDASQRSWLVQHLRDIETRTGWASVGMIAQGCETAWVKAYEAGRGPAYQRTKEEWHMDSLRDSRISRKGGHFDGEADPDPADLTDKRWAMTHAATRVHWAMGLLSVEEDLDGSVARHVSGVQPFAM